MRNYKQKLHKIKAFIFDVDGVLGSSTVLLNQSGELLRTMNIKDGYAMVYAVRQGYLIGIISGGKSDAVNKRFVDLGIKDVYMGSKSKMDCYNDFISKYKLNHDEVLFMGDDLPDYEVMQKVGIAVCPADAAQEIKSVSVYISSINGGDGCVREIIEQVLKLQGKWMIEGTLNW
jgi:3-deoxy-D-manno-octulosonate 8-phosphate phosphatase (KDO 8-P phosphatase)